VHRIVSGFGGTFELESEPDRGTTASIRIPECPAGTPMVQPAAGAGDPAVGTGDPTHDAPPRSYDGARILLVDDEEMVRRTTRLILQRLGYLVEEAEGPALALESLERDPAGVDLVITDQAMPGMSGIALAERLRAVRADLPILIASGFLDETALARIEELGIEGVLQKPYDRSELQSLVERALDG
jgi:CheY-like chemotaxis protein